MSGFIGEDQVRRVKELVDLVQLMGEYTPLRKSGANFAGCCAFHQERTPSMYVYPVQQSYHCFGCGAHGDAITLVREKERLEFSDAIELLARRAGVTLVYQTVGKSALARNDRDELMAAVEASTVFYERMLWESDSGAEAREYLAGRGLSHDICRAFRLGWSPGNGTMVEELRRQKHALPTLAKADLAVDRSGRLVDRFFERVMFPICDRFGNPIAFSARLLPAAERRAKEEGRGVGKYINNTDTPLYHKGAAVFNLHRARTASRDRDRLIVMEGPTDVMAAAQAGYGECVAVLGTALTSDHAKQLGNLVAGGGRLFLVLDGDRAGQANALKAVRTCLAVGVPVRVATLPEEYDPAELLGEAKVVDGKERFEQVLSAARADVDHLVRTLAPRPYELENTQALGVIDQLLEALRPMPDAELRALHLRDVASYFNMDVVRLEKRMGGAVAPAPSSATDTRPESTVVPLSGAREVIVHLLIQQPALCALASDDLGLEPAHFPVPWNELVMRLFADAALDLPALLAVEPWAQDATVRAAVGGWAATTPQERAVPISDVPGELRAQVALVRREALDERLAKLRRDMDDAQRRRDFAAAGELMAEMRAVQQERNDQRGLSG